MNPPTDRSDSALRAWLELGPDRGRPEAIERALAATRRVPQRPGWIYPERWLRVNRAFIAAAAALIIVIGGAAFILRPASNNVGPGGTPAPTSLPSASPGLVPAELMRTWVGVPRQMASPATTVALQFHFEFGQLMMTANYATDYFDSPARVTG